jgi:hypothetical protein
VRCKNHMLSCTVDIESLADDDLGFSLEPDVSAIPQVSASPWKPVEDRKNKSRKLFVYVEMCVAGSGCLNVW